MSTLSENGDNVEKVSRIKKNKMTIVNFGDILISVSKQGFASLNMSKL